MILTFLELLKRTKLHVTEDPDRGSLPDSWFAYFVNDAHTIVCNKIIDTRDDFFLTYRDISLTGALTYNMPRGIERIAYVEDITGGASSPADTSPIRFEDRFWYLNRLRDSNYVRFTYNGGKLSIPDGSSGETLRVYYPIFPKRLFYATVTSAASGTVTLPGTSTLGDIVEEDDYYNGMFLTNDDGQFREITDFVGATRVFTVDENWTTIPTAASVMSLSSPVWPRFQHLIHMEAGLLARIDLNMSTQELGVELKKGYTQME